MKNHRLIQLMSTFSRKEMTRFKEMAESPYFNKHKDVLALVHYLNALFPDFTEKKCNRKAIFQAIFPRQKHNQQHLAVVFTYTHRLLIDYLAQEEWKEEEAYQKILALRYLRKRKQLDFSEKILQNLDKTLSEYPFKDSQFYFLRHHLAAEKDGFQVLKKRSQKDDSFQQKQVYLDQYYLVEKLRDACEKQVRRNIMKVDYSTRLLDAVLQEVQDYLSEYQNVPLVLVYYQLYLMLTHKEPEHYFAVIESLQKNEHFFPKSELQWIYNYLQNYCIAQINLSKGLFMQELFRLYQSQLEKELILEDSLSFEWHYKNIVTVGLRLDEKKWVGEFIEQYKNYLPTEVRENAYGFNLASYYYASGKFSKVLELLTQVEYNHIRYSLGAKALLLRTYYDLGEEEALLSLADSFRHYLQRNKSINKERIVGFKNLVKFTKKAVLLKSQKGFVDAEKWTKDVEKLQQDIQQTENVINRIWLLEKVVGLV